MLPTGHAIRNISSSVMPALLPGGPFGPCGPGSPFSPLSPLLPVSVVLLTHLIVTSATSTLETVKYVRVFPPPVSAKNLSPTVGILLRHSVSAENTDVASRSHEPE